MIALADVNRRCITSCELHRHINHLFERSAFARRAEVQDRQQDRDVSPRPGLFAKHTESPRKQLNRYPVFCLSISMPEDQVEFAFEPNKQVAYLRVSYTSSNADQTVSLCCTQDQQSVNDAIKELVCSFLRAHNFLNPIEKSPDKLHSSPCMHASPTKRIRRPMDLAYRQRALDIPDLPSTQASILQDQHASSHKSSANQPKSNTSRINTDEVRGSPSSSALPTSASQQHSGVQLIDVKHLKRSDRQSQQTSEKPAWLQEVLTGWSNPVFLPLQKPIRSVQARQMPRPEHFHTEAGGTVSSQCSIDKETLHWCDFIAQIDTKFLLFSCPGNNGMKLLLVDQHAADERVRAEGFLRSYCRQHNMDKVEKTTLGEPKAILLAAREIVDIRSSKAWLLRLGFDISVPTRELLASKSSFNQVVVKSVPKIIAERLIADDRLLKSVIQGLLSHVEERDTGGQVNREVSWSTTMKDMPSVLTDLINSKACRGELTGPR